MTELADINARIDRLNRKLKAEPIAFTIELPTKVSIGQYGWQLQCTARQNGTRYKGSIAFRFVYLSDCLVLWDEATDVFNGEHAEFIPLDIKLFARKIQLAILERLTG